MDYATACEWLELHNVVVNRISIVNQILGARYDGCMENPLLLTCNRGDYVLRVCGVEYVSWHAYDLASTRDAYGVVESLKRGLWLLRRSGLYDFTKNRPTDKT